MLNKAVDAHEGCILEGWLDLRKVAGNFKISIHMDDYFMLRKVCVSQLAPFLLQPWLALCSSHRLSSCLPTPAVHHDVLFSAFAPSFVARRFGCSPSTRWNRSRAGRVGG